MQHCSGYSHMRESCIMSNIEKPPQIYMKAYMIGSILQIPSFLMKQNLKLSLIKAHEFALWITGTISMGLSFLCLGNAIFVLKGPVKRAYRLVHTPFLTALSCHISSRYLVPNVSWTEYFGIWYGQVAP